jgi:hypothetical protein
MAEELSLTEEQAAASQAAEDDATRVMKARPRGADRRQYSHLKAQHQQQQQQQQQEQQKK